MTNSKYLAFPSGQSVEQAKKDAKKLKKSLGCTQAEALDKIARRNGVDKPWFKAIEELSNRLSVIELALLDLSSGKQGEIWSQFVTPSLKLSEHRNVGVILGQSGTGKSILANSFMQEALESGYTIYYRDVFGVQNVTELTREHPEDKALNQCRQLARNNAEQFIYLTESDAIPIVKSKELLVIDEVDYQLNEQLQVHLREYIKNGGLLLLVDQDNHAIENLLESDLSVGFTAVSGKYQRKIASIEFPPDLHHLLEPYARDIYPWICISHKGLAIGSYNLV